MAMKGLLVQILGLLGVPYPGAQEPHQHRTDLVQQLAIRVRVAALRRGHQAGPAPPRVAGLLPVHVRLEPAKLTLGPQEQAAPLGHLLGAPRRARRQRDLPAPLLRRGEVLRVTIGREDVPGHVVRGATGESPKMGIDLCPPRSG